MKWYASAESPSSPASSAKRFVSPLPFQTETCTWQPLPVRWEKGLGMNVARSPWRSAIDLTMNLKKQSWSAVVSASAKSQLISNCPFASSWSFWYGPQPSAVMVEQMSATTS